MAVNLGHLAPHHYSLVALEDAGRRRGSVILPICEVGLVFFLFSWPFFFVSRVASLLDLSGGLALQVGIGCSGLQDYVQTSILPHELSGDGNQTIKRRLAGVGRKLLQILWACTSYNHAYPDVIRYIQKQLFSDDQITAHGVSVVPNIPLIWNMENPVVHVQIKIDLQLAITQNICMYKIIHMDLKVIMQSA